MSTVSVTIDNIKVSVPAETTILQAAKSAGINIPTLCAWVDAGHTPGACRVCSVEVEGMPTLVASCVYPVREGMVVKTNSEVVRKSRKMILELLLADHPGECNYCVRNGLVSRIDLKSPKRERKQRTKRDVNGKDTYHTSLDLFRDGLSIPEIARERSLSVTTIENHLARFIPTGEVRLDQFVAIEKVEPIREAIENPRELDRRLVAAQEARRILDRLYGYEVSPVLWKKIMPRLSAGRVQSVATRIVVERERERMRFKSASYWDLAASLQPAAPDSMEFSANLIAVDGQRVATGRDFSEFGELQRADALVLNESAAEAL